MNSVDFVYQTYTSENCKNTTFCLLFGQSSSGNIQTHSELVRTYIIIYQSNIGNYSMLNLEKSLGVDVQAGEL